MKLKWSHYSISALFDACSGYFEDLLEPKEENRRIRLNTMQVLLGIIAPNPASIPQDGRSVLIKMISKNITFRAGRVETAIRLLSGKESRFWPFFGKQRKFCQKFGKKITKLNFVKTNFNMHMNDRFDGQAWFTNA